MAIFLTAFLTSYVCIWLLMRFPRGQPRASGARHLLCTGGIAFFLAIIISFTGYCVVAGACIPFRLTWLLLASFAMLLTGFADDTQNFSFIAKGVFQAVIIWLFLVYGKRVNMYFLPSWANYCISFIWLMAMTNAFNHLDIADGLCAGIALCAGSAFLAASWVNGTVLLTAFFIAVCGALTGFLVFNLPPARLFMGNAGSHALGFLFAAVSMYTDYATARYPFALLFPVFILLFPALDTAFVSIARLKRGILPFRKSNDHMFMRLRSFLASERSALVSFYWVTVLWCAAGVFLAVHRSFLTLILTAAALFFTVRLILRAHRAGVSVH